MSKHVNDGACSGCLAIINRYPGFHSGLLQWFQGFQKVHPEAHTSCAGRGENDQEALFLKKATRAHWGQSAHNYNCALDIFETSTSEPGIYSRQWFRDVLSPALPDWVQWYGSKDSAFYELPHLEVKDFKNLIATGAIKLVE